MFKGILTALVTPFTNTGVDYEAYSKFVDWQIKEGVHGVVPCGTTGETATLTDEEYQKVIEVCVKTVNKRVPVIAGSGSNSTEKTIYYSKIAEAAGADALLIASPYYNKPTQEGLFLHFKAAHDATNIPIVLYDVPGRSVVEISVDVIGRLSQLPRIVAIKDATNALAKPLHLSKVCAKDFCQISGEDATSLAHAVQGGEGCISVVSNMAPRLCSEMYNAWFKGDIKKAQEINLLLQPLRDLAFCETNPIPAKCGVSLLGFGNGEMRLPMTSATEGTRAKLEAELGRLGLI